MVTFLQKIDWVELRAQKDWLSRQQVGPQQEAEGLLCLLDALQDYAAGPGGVGEGNAYGPQDITDARK